MSPGFTPPEICPVCGADVPRRARACPGCGADERSGWDEEAARYDGLDLPEENSGQTRRNTGRQRFWFSVGVILLILAVLGWLFPP